MTRTRKRADITPNYGPTHLSDLPLSYEPSRIPRFSGHGLLLISEVRTETHGEASFITTTYNNRGQQRMLVFSKENSTVNICFSILIERYVSNSLCILLYP